MGKHFKTFMIHQCLVTVISFVMVLVKKASVNWKVYNIEHQWVNIFTDKENRNTPTPTLNTQN